MRFRNEIGLLLAVVVVVVVTTCFSSSYRLKPGPNAEILRQTSLLGIFALGAAIVIISGGIDLSSGSGDCLQRIDRCANPAGTFALG